MTKNAFKTPTGELVTFEFPASVGEAIARFTEPAIHAVVVKELTSRVRKLVKSGLTELPDSLVLPKPPSPFDDLKREIKSLPDEVVRELVVELEMRLGGQPK